MSRYLQDYSYSYPENLVARYPSDKRDASRLMILNRDPKTIHHQKFSDMGNFFEAGDVLVINDSRVFPSRLVTQRSSGGRQEILLVRPVNSPSPHGTHPLLTRGGRGSWHVLVNASHKIKNGEVFSFDEMGQHQSEATPKVGAAGRQGRPLLMVTFIDDHDEKKETRLVELKYHGDLAEVLKRVGHVPLPPYLGREDEARDHERYQTVYAQEAGSVAAPTAGLHFTPEILAALKAKGVTVVPVTLHVGLGTFLPVRTDDITEHKMHSETFFLSNFSRGIINQAKKDGRCITAVGTTSTRVLESLADENGILRDTENSWQSTKIFIYPPYKFKIIDRLITNFHQPESTLLMLVSAFSGREFVLSAYQEAIKKQYRLFSYGDCMMVT